MPWGVFDWDAAGLGDPLDDLAYAVWLWLDMGNPELDPRELRGRISLFLDAYGLSPQSRRGFGERILGQMERVAASAAGTEEQAKATEEWALSCRDWLAARLGELS